MPSAASSSETTAETLQHVSIRVGENQQEVVFANLSVDERMADTNQFSFIWKNDFNDDYTNDQEKFIQTFIGEKVSISLDGNHTFKGIILEISFYRNDGLTQEFNIHGQGLGVKLLDHEQSASYYKKTLKDIISDSMKGIASNELSIDCQPKNTAEQFYTVQFNETDFDFIRHLAARHGEWFYYNGEKLVFGKIDENPFEVNMGSDIFNASFASNIRPMNLNSASYNNFSGEQITSTGSAPSSQGLLNSLNSASSGTFDRTPTKKQHLPQSPTKASLDAQVNLAMKAKASKLITFSASSRNAKIKLGTTIKVVDGSKSSAYIITQVQHTSNTAESYANHFVAIPASVQVPTYTDAQWFPKAETQTAIITNNEDEVGLDRVKVRFPWQQSNVETPWIRLQNPYAGKNKGFRFVPEVGEEVLVSFENGNAEKPFVAGAVFHGKAKSGEKHDSNHVKMISTATLGRLEFHEGTKILTLADGYNSEDAIQGLVINKKKGEANFASNKDQNNRSIVFLNQDKELTIQILKGGSPVLNIVMDGDGKELRIDSKGSIKISADNSISLDANNIELNAMDIKIKAKKALELEGLEIKGKATTTLALEGMQTTLKGQMTEVAGTMTTIKGDGMTMVKGGVVMIN